MVDIKKPKQEMSTERIIQLMETVIRAYISGQISKAHMNNTLLTIAELLN